MAVHFACLAARSHRIQCETQAPKHTLVRSKPSNHLRFHSTWARNHGYMIFGSQNCGDLWSMKQRFSIVEPPQSSSYIIHTLPTLLLRQHEEAKSSLGSFLSLCLASKPLLHISRRETPHNPNVCRIGHTIFLQTRIHHATVGWNPRRVKTCCAPRLLKSMSLVINARHSAN